MSKKNVYQVRTKDNGKTFNILKFDEDFNYEQTYNVVYSGNYMVCDCFAGIKSVCRHRTMIKIFSDKNAINTGEFYNFDTKTWFPAVKIE